MNDEIKDILAHLASYQVFPAIKEDANEVMKILHLFKKKPLEESPLEKIELQKSLEKLNQILLKNISIDFNKILKKTKKLLISNGEGEQDLKKEYELDISLPFSPKRSSSFTFFPFPTQASWEEVQRHLGCQS